MDKRQVDGARPLGEVQRGKEPVVGAEKVDELDAEVDEYVYSQVSQLEIKLKPII